MLSVNPWHKFKALLPGGKRTVLTIAADLGNGTVRATTNSGISMIIKGSGSSGDRVLVLDGEIRQVLPALPQDSVEV